MHPAVLSLVSNSLFVVYLPIYWLNLRWRRRRAADAHAVHAAESAALVPAAQPRSDKGGALAGGGLGPEDSSNGKAGAVPGAVMPLRQLFHAALIVSG